MNAHYIKENKGTETPTLAVYFDTESATTVGISQEEIDYYMDQQRLDTRLMWPEIRTAEKQRRHKRFDHRHTHYLTCACFVRDKSETWRDYYGATLNQFWADVSEFVRTRKRCYVFAHNARYDVLVSGAVPLLRAEGWSIVGFSESNPFFMRFTKGNSTIMIISTTNYFPDATVKALGEMLGIPKLTIEYSGHDPEKALTYCRRDVEIIKQTMEKLYMMIQTENLGNFGMTIASLSFNAYRHKFMEKASITLHREVPALILERDAYAGGRNEAWRIGPQPGVISCYDVNSMYPSVMLDCQFPTRLVSFRKSGTIADLRRAIERGYLCIASVQISTSCPVVPVKDKRLIFPVGTFWTSLCTPELRYCLDHDLIDDVAALAIYDSKKLFTSFVEYFYEARLQAKASGNQIMTYFYKRLLNSLYGKFGQKRNVFELKDSDCDPDDCYESRVYDVATGQTQFFKAFGGSLFVKLDLPDGENEAMNSFPAIAAHVTSYARMRLWHYIELAGMENVVYMDTDSVFVTAAGAERLEASGVVDPSKLGLIKLEKQTDHCIIRGCKDYTFGEVSHIKGIPKSAVQLTDTDYLTMQWPGIAPHIKAGNLHGYETKVVLKSLKREYEKGTVDPSGKVLPFIRND